jgi:ArsR family transcriptional regulator
MKKKNNTRLAPAFRAMADSTRLKMLLMLEGKPRTVGEIVSFFDLSQPTITRHLQTLTAASLVRRTRKGQHVYYELDPDTLRTVCVELVACFPCCSISMHPLQNVTACTISSEDTKEADRPRVADGKKVKPTKTRRKGGKP